MKASWILFFWHLTLLVARAEDAPAPNPAVSPLLPLLLMGLVFYFLIIRPQSKKQKQHQQFLSELKRGDMIITNGGIIGMVKTLSDKLVTLEVDDGVCIKMLRTQVLENANSLKEENKEKSKRSK